MTDKTETSPSAGAREVARETGFDERHWRACKPTPEEFAVIDWDAFDWAYAEWICAAPQYAVERLLEPLREA